MLESNRFESQLWQTLILHRTHFNYTAIYTNTIISSRGQAALMYANTEALMAIKSDCTFDQLELTHGPSGDTTWHAVWSPVTSYLELHAVWLYFDRHDRSRDGRRRIDDRLSIEHSWYHRLYKVVISWYPSSIRYKALCINLQRQQPSSDADDIARGSEVSWCCLLYWNRANMCHHLAIDVVVNEIACKAGWCLHADINSAEEEYSRRQRSAAANNRPSHHGSLSCVYTSVSGV